MEEPDAESMEVQERLEREIAKQDPNAPKDRSGKDDPAESPAKQGPGVI